MCPFSHLPLSVSPLLTTNVKKKEINGRPSRLFYFFYGPNSYYKPLTSKYTETLNTLTVMTETTDTVDKVDTHWETVPLLKWYKSIYYIFYWDSPFRRKTQILYLIQLKWGIFYCLQKVVVSRIWTRLIITREDNKRDNED